MLFTFVILEKENTNSAEKNSDFDEFLSNFDEIFSDFDENSSEFDENSSDFDEKSSGFDENCSIFDGKCTEIDRLYFEDRFLFAFLSKFSKFGTDFLFLRVKNVSDFVSKSSKSPEFLKSEFDEFL